jgi:hypothetical protein
MTENQNMQWILMKILIKRRTAVVAEEMYFTYQEDRTGWISHLPT